MTMSTRVPAGRNSTISGPPTPAAAGRHSLPSMSETDLLNATMDLAKLFGWRRIHLRPALTTHGYRTSVQGDGVGFPDILFLRGDSQIVVELKSAKGIVSPEQDAWLDAFRVAGVDAFVWRPEHWHNGDIERALAR